MFIMNPDPNMSVQSFESHKSRIHLHLQAINLRNVSRRLTRLRSRSDPYAIVEADGDIIGRTETVINDLSPSWTKTIILGYTPNSSFTIKVSIFDDNSDHNKTDVLMGSASFPVEAILSLENKMMKQRVGKGKGELILHAHEFAKGSDEGSVNFQFRAIDVKNIDYGFLRLNSTDPFFEISKKYSDPKAGFSKWMKVYTSEYKNNHLNPVWDPFQIDMEELCNCDLNNLVKISLFDWENSRKHRLVGSVETTVKNLMEHKTTRGNADKESAIKIRSLENSTSKPVAYLVVLQAERGFNE